MPHHFQNYNVDMKLYTSHWINKVNLVHWAESNSNNCIYYTKNLGIFACKLVNHTCYIILGDLKSQCTTLHYMNINSSEQTAKVTRLYTKNVKALLQG